MLKTNLFLFPILFCLFKTSVCLKFSCFKDFSAYQLVTVTFFFQAYLQLITSFIKKGVSRTKFLKTQSLPERETWHELAGRYWCVLVGFTYTSITSWLPFFMTVTSRKSIFVLEYSAVNFIVGWYQLRVSKNLWSSSSPCSHES